jgi:uncharacterized protein
MLNHDQQVALLRIARLSIAAAFEGSSPKIESLALDEGLRRPAGAFVTLNLDGSDLRGCIGSIEPVSPLYLAVASNARAAAFRDPRFAPLSRGEFERVTIEISVLSPVEPVSDPEKDVQVGRDGLIVSRGSRKGLLLPQVATEYGWDRRTFLSQTCVKAGLEPSAWQKPGTAIEKFSAQVFGEHPPAA